MILKTVLDGEGCKYYTWRSEVSIPHAVVVKVVMVGVVVVVVVGVVVGVLVTRAMLTTSS